MNFFKKLFGMENNNGNPEISKDLFVDDTPPGEMRQEKPVSDSAVRRFLLADYGTQGFRDGHFLHSTDALESALRHLKSEFRLIVDEAVDKHQQDINGIKQHIIQTSGISERLQSQLELRIQSLTGIVQQLQREKELSIEEEGLVAKPLNSYRQGFLRGLEQYQLEKFIAGSTGLFN